MFKVDINELIKLQKEFDSQHKGNFNWDEKIKDNNLELLEYLLICILGELGETSNLVKKIIRGDYKLDEIRDDLSEEIIDILIYVIKLIYQLDIDVEKEYYKKMEKNKIKFTKYQKE